MTDARVELELGDRIAVREVQGTSPKAAGATLGDRGLVPG